MTSKPSMSRSQHVYVNNVSGTVHCSTSPITILLLVPRKLSSVPGCALHQPRLIFILAMPMRWRRCVQAPPQAGQFLITGAQRLAQTVMLRSEPLELALRLHSRSCSCQMGLLPRP